MRICLAASSIWLVAQAAPVKCQPLRLRYCRHWQSCLSTYHKYTDENYVPWLSYSSNPSSIYQGWTERLLASKQIVAAVQLLDHALQGWIFIAGSDLSPMFHWRPLQCLANFRCASYDIQHAKYEALVKSKASETTCT